jgi:hypothetical protein
MTPDELAFLILDTESGMQIADMRSKGQFTSFALHQNYPNPFNPSTTIKFTLPQRSDIRLVLVNVLGQVLKEIATGNYSAGSHQVTLDASHLASGIYFYELQAGSFSETKKLVLMK